MHSRSASDVGDTGPSCTILDRMENCVGVRAASLNSERSRLASRITDTRSIPENLRSPDLLGVLTSPVPFAISSPGHLKSSCLPPILRIAFFVACIQHVKSDTLALLRNETSISHNPNSLLARHQPTYHRRAGCLALLSGGHLRNFPREGT